MKSVCGLDVHKDSVYLCILSEFGELIEKVFGVLTYQLEGARLCLLSFCHSVYLCKIGVKMLLFRCFFILCKACLQAKHHHLKIVNMPFMKHKHNTYEAQTWPLAKTVTTKKIKLPLNKEVYTQTMLMARHQKIAKLFDEDFWVTQ